jgi:TonB-linked SusC/RagA family outer membrane protein
MNKLPLMAGFSNDYICSDNSTKVQRMKSVFRFLINKVSIVPAFMFLLASSTLGQDLITIQGKVTDAGSGEPIIGANVIQEGTSIGTITDFDGMYTLEVDDPEAILLFSYVGYGTKEIKISGRKLIDVVLVQSSEVLDELVVIGYGKVKKKDLTGAVTQVSGDEFEQRTVGDISEALAGTMAGVQVSSISGAPGSEAFISIRGISTINDNGVLWVVDGMPVGSVSYLNPQDIASVHILKDASSAAIYGSEAANGVVLIETKKGEKGSLSVELNARRGMQYITRKPQMADVIEYARIQNTGWLNDGGDEASVPYPNPEELGTGTNWWTETTQSGFNAPTQDYYLSINKGEENFNISTSLSYFSQEGVLKGGGYDRINFRLNTEFKPYKKVTIGENLIFSNQRTTNGPDDYLVWDAQRVEPVTPVFLPEYEQEGRNEFSIFSPTIVDVSNPVGGLARNFSQDRSLSTVGNLFFTYDPWSFLQFKTEIGLELETWENQWFGPNYYIEETDKREINEVGHHMGNKYVYNWNNILTFTRSFDKHNLSAMAATTTYSDTWRSVNGTGKNTPSNHPDLRYLTSTSSGWTANGGSYSEITKFSYLGRVNYSFANKYLLMASVRRDGSSKFPVSNRWATFPSVSLGWNLSEEAFLTAAWVDILKLRASWGQIGNDGIPYWAQYSTIADYHYVLGVNQQVLLGKGPDQVGNSKLKWETVEDINIGLDYELLNGKLSGSFDVFRRNTRDMLMQKSLLGYMGAGFGRQWANVGSMESQGIEFNISHRNTLDKFRYQVGLNITHTNSTMKNVADGETILDGNDQRLDMLTYTAENSPIGAFYGYVTDGIFQNETEVINHTDEFGHILQPSAQPGDFRFVDINGDGRITAEGDRKIIGNPDADFTFGLNLGLSYGNLDLRCLVTGSYGNDIITPIMAYTHSGSADYNSYAGLYADAWSGEGTSVTQPRISNNDPNLNFRYSDYYISDGSYIRLKSVQLGYTFPPSWTSSVGIDALKIFLNAENLVTLTGYEGLDPDIGPYAYNILLRGVDWGNYPLPGKITLGLNLSF